MLSNQRLSSRKSLYLITSRTGVFTFRWNLRVNGKHHQPTLSQKTRDYLQAVKFPSEIAICIQQVTEAGKLAHIQLSSISNGVNSQR